MEIEDKRKETDYIPAVEIINDITQLIPQEYVVGIRKIVLLDDDYHKGGKAAGRYCPVEGTNRADIELYFRSYDKFPIEAKSSRLFLTYRITYVLMHEVYHHVIRGQHRLRGPKFKVEQKKADRWAYKVVGHVFNKRFPKEKYLAEWEKMLSILHDTKNKYNNSI